MKEFLFGRIARMIATPGTWGGMQAVELQVILSLEIYMKMSGKDELEFEEVYTRLLKEEFGYSKVGIHAHTIGNEKMFQRLLTRLVRDVITTCGLHVWWCGWSVKGSDQVGMSAPNLAAWRIDKIEGVATWEGLIFAKTADEAMGYVNACFGDVDPLWLPQDHAKDWQTRGLSL